MQHFPAFPDDPTQNRPSMQSAVDWHDPSQKLWFWYAQISSPVGRIGWHAPSPHEPHVVAGTVQCAPESVVVVDDDVRTVVVVWSVVVLVVLALWEDVVVVVTVALVVVVDETSSARSVVVVVDDPASGAQSSRDLRGLTRCRPNSSVTVVAARALRRQRSL